MARLKGSHDAAVLPWPGICLLSLLLGCRSGKKLNAPNRKEFVRAATPI